MKCIKLYSVLITGFLLCAGPIQTHAQQKPGEPTASPADIASIQRVLDKIKELKKDLYGDHEQEIRALYNLAIKLTDHYYRIYPPGNVEGGEAEFDPMLGEDFEIDQKGNKIKVRLGPSAFLYPSWLAATKMLAYYFALQIEDGRKTLKPPNPFENDDNPERVDEFEEGRKKFFKTSLINSIEALDILIRDGYKIGLSTEDLEIHKLIRKELFDALDRANQKRVTDLQARGLPYKIDIDSSSAKSMKTLTENTALFVPENVLSEERMLVTVRGTKMIQGKVVSAELNGKTTTATTDKEGHAILDMSVIAGGQHGDAVVNIKILDPGGKQIGTATTTIQPGYPMIFDRPLVTQLPDNIPSGEVVKIPGKNLGADANLVIGEQFQETLSASDKELTVFTDCKTGIQSVYVITANGVSQSQDVNIYSLDFSLPKSSINRKEVVIAEVHYESIPVGTKLIFTNNSPGTIKMEIPGGNNMGNQCNYTITATNGTIPVNITGKTRGSFIIALNMDFTNGNPVSK